MTHRFQTADLLKGIAILLMVQVHIIELFATESVYNSTGGKLVLFLGGPPVAPVFMILFGYFIAQSRQSAGQLMLRGAGIFALGMGLNLALNFNLILSVTNGSIEQDIWPYIFGVDILQFAGISLIIITIIKGIEKNGILLLTLCILSALAGQHLAGRTPESTALQYISAFFYGSTKWSYFPLFPWLAYPLAGMIFYKLQTQYNLKIRNTYTKMIAYLLSATVLAFTIGNAVSVSSDLPAYYHHGILFFIWVILFVSLYALCLDRVNAFAGNTPALRYIKWLGQHVTLIYAIQWILIGNTATEIYKTVSSPLYLAGCLLAVLLVSSSVAYGTLRMQQYFKKGPAREIT
jgi:uncharacterized membrane protein